MSYSISTLLIRNLHDVFGENDAARRRAAIEEIFTEYCVFYELRGVHRGRDEIDRVAGAIKATHPDFQYQPVAEPEELGNSGRIQWVSGRPRDSTSCTGSHAPEGPLPARRGIPTPAVRAYRLSPGPCSEAPEDRKRRLGYCLSL
jgi:hypothetical protein